MDEDIKEIVRMLVRCAFGSPQDSCARIPSHKACVEVAVRENAFNPLSSPSTSAERDETIYVAFQQTIRFQVWYATPRRPLDSGVVCNPPADH